MLSYFGESILSFLTGVAGIVIILLVLCVVFLVGYCLFIGIQFVLWKCRLVDEPGWHEWKREKKERLAQEK